MTSSRLNEEQIAPPSSEMDSMYPLSSPRLPSFFDATSPATPTTPTPDSRIGQRPVQKQVVRVKGLHSETLVKLYLKLVVPRSSHTYPLFPDENVSLKASQVYPVSVGKGGRVLIPPNASPSLLKAFDALAISGTATANSPISESSNSASNNTAPKVTRKSRITTSNFHVCFIVPPGLDTYFSQANDEKLHFIAIVHMAVKFTHQPPRWPYMVRGIKGRARANRS
jgi:hypothetical protein